MAQPPTIQLKDFCRLFKFQDRQVRFVLERGFVPKGVASHPTTGNRREFGPSHAFWLAIALQLKLNGIKTPIAAKIADITTENLRILTQNHSWDWTFLPMKGWFETDHQYYLDLGDLRFVRIVTDANPSVDGLHELEWVPVVGRGRIGNHSPFVIFRVDLTKIAKVLSQVEGWVCPHRHGRTK